MQMHSLTLCWVPLFLLFVPTCIASGYGATIPEIRYDVRLEMEPAPDRVDMKAPPTVDVYSKYGQKFRCQVPVMLSSGKSSPPPVNNSFINSALSRLNSSQCLTKAVDWWTYELCYGRYILQFHQEQNVRQAETLLGHFESETNWSTVVNITGEGPLVHNQSYVNGSICGLTFQRRRAEVHYKCYPGDVSFRIISVEELETCVYRLEVSAPTLCTHQSFSPEKRIHTEPIFCNPILPNIVTSGEKQTPSLTVPAHQRSNKRVFNLANIARKRSVERANRKRRMMKQRMRMLLQLMIDPVAHESPNSYVFYTQHVVSNASHDSFSLPFPVLVEHNDLLQWALELTHLELPNAIFEGRFGFRTLASDSIPPKGLAVIRSLGSFIISLVEAKISHITEPQSQPIHYPHEKITSVIQVFNEICKELERHHTPEFLDAVVEDLEKLYDEYGNTGKASTTDLVGTSLDDETEVRIASRTPKGTGWHWSFTPGSMISLRKALQLIKRQFLLLDHFMKASERFERLQGAESSFERHLKELLSDVASKVLVIRNMEDKLDKDEDTDDDQDDDGEQSDRPGASSRRRKSTTDMMHQLMSMVNKFLSRVPSEQVQDLEVYEAGNVNGVKTFYIVSSEERGREQRKMRQLENAYKFVDPSSNPDATEDNKQKGKTNTGSAGI